MAQDILFYDTAGWSMYPFIKSGDKIIVKSVPLERLHVGDIILFNSEGKTVCHRIIRIKRERGGLVVMSRGDSQFGKGESVTKDMVLGKVIGLYKGKRVVNLETPYCRVVGLLMIYGGPFIERSPTSFS